MTYRADIDGLRAVAVLPVLFFHAGWTTFSGGYVGVDVFFVISGFLITGILAQEIAADRFSILAFYERRARRILPALFAMLVACSAAAIAILTPRDLAGFATSVAATVGFASNILFYGEAGYFEELSATKPLLHTWSLAVEEQFYIAFPLVLWLIQRYARRRLVVTLALLAAASLGFCLWHADDDRSLAFFMPHTRFWELLVGALLALGAAPDLTEHRLRAALAWAGLALIAVTVFAFSAATPFPGLSTLAPVGGAALVIQYAPGTSVAKLLSLRPLVLIGLISYSLYLWHWPVVVFAEYALFDDLSGWSSLAIILVALALACLSWRFVEQPFRRGQSLSRRRLLGAAACVAATLAAFGAAAIAADGWPGRVPSAVARLEAAAGDFSPRRFACHRGEGLKIAIADSCRLGGDAPAAYAVWGDSHAVELAFALGERAGRQGQSLLQFTYSACPPALDLKVRRRKGCREFNDETVRFLAAASGIATIFLVARYDVYEESEAFAEGIRRSVRTLTAAGKRVVLVYPIPTATRSVPRMLARYAATGRALDEAATSEASFLADNTEALRLLDSIQGPGIVHVMPHRRLCHDGRCILQVDGAPLYFDHQHLSVTGARYLMPLFEDLF